MAMAWRLLALALAVEQAHAAGDPGSTLMLTYVITRHGSRNLLPKSSVLTDVLPQGDVTLLPSGQRQCWAAGQAFAQRYLNFDSCSAAGGAADQPSNTCLSPPGSPGALSAAGANYGVVTDKNVTW